jgi:hypothetical protein
MKEVKGRRARLKLKCFESLDHQHLGHSALVQRHTISYYFIMRTMT